VRDKLAEDIESPMNPDLSDGTWRVGLFVMTSLYPLLELEDACDAGCEGADVAGAAPGGGRLSAPDKFALVNDFLSSTLATFVC
jgi:hypothetical protein